MEEAPGTNAPTARANGAEQSKRRNRRRMIVLLALALTVGLVCGVLPGLAGAVAGIGGIVPHDFEAICASHPPIEDRSGRVIAASGCGLNERASGSGCAPITSARFDEEDVAFPSRHPDRGLAELVGTISLPRDVGDRRPAAVLIHGSGPNCRDQPLAGDLLTRYDPPMRTFRLLAAELARQGIVVLRYDKRACHDYGPDFAARLDPSRLVWSWFTDDARDALEYLSTRPEVDADRLIVIGHSEGGQLAPFAAEGDPRVAAVVMLAGTTQRFADGLFGQLGRFADHRRSRFDYFTAWAVELQFSALRTCIEQLDGPSYDPDDGCVGGGVTLRALEEYHRYSDRTGEVMRSLACPILALQGNADINIDPEEIPRMQEILRGRDAELHRIHGVSHALTNVLGPGQPPELDAQVLEVLRAFLASVKRPPAGA